MSRSHVPTSAPGRDRRAGFSTINSIMSLTLLGLILTPVLGTILGGQRGFTESWDRARAAGSARFAHLSLTRLIRSAGSNPVGGSVQAVDPDPLGDGVFDDIRLRSDFNPPDGDTDDPGEDLSFYVRGDTMFVLASGGTEEPYLIGVDSLAFEYFDVDGNPITDPERVGRRAVSARITIRARGEAPGGNAVQLLVGSVRLRNGR